MNIGIDFDGVLTNDEEYIMATLYKYCVEHNPKKRVLVNGRR